MDSSRDTMTIGGFAVKNSTAAPTACMLIDRIKRREKSILLFANTNFIIKCRHLAQRLQQPEVTVLNDGIGLDLAALLIHRRRFSENLNGTDFIPYLFSCADRPLRVFLLGAGADVIYRAAHFADFGLGADVVGASDGFIVSEDCGTVIDAINVLKPEVLLVGMGNPKQEDWILHNLEHLDTCLVIGVGGLFDFWAGNKPRAPMLVRRARLEWLYRLCMEPRRLMRRYTLDIFLFFMHCLRH